MGKRRRRRQERSSPSLKPGENDSLTPNALEHPTSSPVDWLSSIQKHSPSLKTGHSTPELVIKIKKLDSVDSVTSGYSPSAEHANNFTDKSPTSGLKTSSFYGGKTPSFQFSHRRRSPDVNKQLVHNDSIKKNGEHKGKARNQKRKHKSQKNSKNQVAKRAKKDIQVEDCNIKNTYNGAVQHHESHNGIIDENKEESGSIINGHCKTSTILDMITPESSPSDSSDLLTSIHTNGTTVGFSKSLSEQKSVVSKEKLVINTTEDVFSELGSVYSEDSLVSGPGSIKSSALIKEENGEYYFSNSNESSPDLSHNGPSKLFQTPTSSKSSPESEVSLFGNKERTVFLFGKDTDANSSYIPSCNSSNSTSPEHQTSITTFFKSTTMKQRNAVASKSKKLDSRSKRSNKDKKMEQMYLDLGQRNFGHVTCTTCGMVYTHAQPDDEVEHIRHHKKFVNGLRFNGWKDEHVVKEFSDGRIIMIKPDDHPSHQKKAEEIRKVVDSELGFAVDLPYRKNESKTFLFIVNKRVVGCCVATQIDKGYPVLPSTPNKDSTPDRQIAAWCCSTVSVPAQCGISKIWVWNQYRRKKVATRLIECVRTHFIYGCVISKDVLAFSDPTPDGKRLATAYIGTPEFLVFH